MKRFLFSLLVCTAFFLTFRLSALEQTGEGQIIALVTGTLLQRNHYLKVERNPESAGKFLHGYLKQLDPLHLYFTADQVRFWEQAANTMLWNLDSGNAAAGYQIFSSYLGHLKEYERFVRSLDLKKLDLRGKDTFEADRSKAPWPENAEARKKLWLGKIKNDLITLKLMDRLEQEEEASGKKKKVIWNSKSPEERLLKRVTNFVRYNAKLEEIEVLALYLNAFAGLYDPHTLYMPPKDEEDFNMSMSLSLTGIGAVLSASDDGYTKIVEIMPGGPADRDGRLAAGDRIISVTQDGGEEVDIVDMSLSKVVSMIRGKAGTKVTLRILDGKLGASGRPKLITLTRDRVILKESEAKSEIREIRGDDGKMRRIGIIVLPSFYADFKAFASGNSNYKSSTRDVKNLIRALRKEKPLDVLVMDLRSNGGGSLAEAVSMAGLFIPEGPVVQVRDGDGEIRVEMDEDGGSTEWNGPLIVVTNRLSASASEIFAGAIQDYRRGILVGDRSTHGKGTVQVVQELRPILKYIGTDLNRDAGILKFTASKFYRVSGSSTQLKGVEPDIVFPSFTDAMEIGEDKLTNPMPWDSVEPAEGVKKLVPAMETILPAIREKSLRRIRKNTAFLLLRKDIEHYRKRRAEKTVSLNIDERWREYQEEKKISDEQTKLLKLDADSSAVSEKKKNRARDIYLLEILRIACDYAKLQEKTP